MICFILFHHIVPGVLQCLKSSHQISSQSLEMIHLAMVIIFWNILLGRSPVFDSDHRLQTQLGQRIDSTCDVFVSFVNCRGWTIPICPGIPSEATNDFPGVAWNWLVDVLPRLQNHACSTCYIIKSWYDNMNLLLGIQMFAPFALIQW